MRPSVDPLLLWLHLCLGENFVALFSGDVAPTWDELVRFTSCMGDSKAHLSASTARNLLQLDAGHARDVPVQRCKRSEWSFL